MVYLYLFILLKAIKNANTHTMYIHYVVDVKNYDNIACTAYIKNNLIYN